MLVRSFPQLPKCSRVAIRLQHSGRAVLANSSKKKLQFGPLGFGSSNQSWIFQKDAGKIDQIKAYFKEDAGNKFLQANVNGNTHCKLGVEAIALNELFGQLGDEKKPLRRREEIIMSILLDDDFENPPKTIKDISARFNGGNLDRLLVESVEQLDVETIDHVVLRFPSVLFSQSSSLSSFFSASSSNDTSSQLINNSLDWLESKVSANDIQTYGIALPPLFKNLNGQNVLNSLEEVFQRKKDGEIPHLASVQYPVNLLMTGNNWQLMQQINKSCRTQHLHVIGENGLSSRQANGKPFHFHSTTLEKTGEEIAVQLEKAFNFGLNVEEKFSTQLRPKYPDLPSFPDVEEIAWVQYLVANVSEFDSLPEWVYCHYQYILPRFEATMKQLLVIGEKEKPVKDFAFAYTVAVKQVLQAVTESLNFQTQQDLLVLEKNLQRIVPVKTETAISLKERMVKLALALGFDSVLLDQSIIMSTSPTEETTVSSEQLSSLFNNKLI